MSQRVFTPYERVLLAGMMKATGSEFQLLYPEFDCATKRFKFRTTGGDGGTIQYMAIGITGWTLAPEHTIDVYNDMGPFKLFAKQGNNMVSLDWDWKTHCAGGYNATPTPSTTTPSTPTTTPTPTTPVPGTTVTPTPGGVIVTGPSGGAVVGGVVVPLPTPANPTPANPTPAATNGISVSGNQLMLLGGVLLIVMFVVLMYTMIKKK